MIGRTVSHYQVVEKLGSGGMGVVYRATDLRLGRSVALKFLPDEFARDGHALDRLRQEAKAASALNHPNIRTIHDIDEVELPEAGQTVPFIVMELLEGRTLDHHVGSRPMDASTWLALGIQVADALGAAHARGIVHRDVKPENIFVTGEGIAKVLDFGLARTAAVLDPAAASTRFTQPGTTLGTPAYMSPEQIRGEPSHPSSDVFSLGVVLYEMATGRLPFCGPTLGVMFDAILNREPVPPRAINPRIDPDIERVVLRAIEKDPAGRYPSAADLSSDLRRIRQRMDSGQAVLPADLRLSGIGSGRTARGRQRRWWLTAAAGLLVIAGAAAWLSSASTRYQPCVAIGPVQVPSGQANLDADLVGFALRRGLLQFSEPRVCELDDFAAAGEKNRDQPAVVASVTLRRLPGSRMAIDLTVKNRGKGERDLDVYSDLDRLVVTDGSDAVVRRILERFDASSPGHAPARPAQRSLSELLSDNPDAVSAYWQGLKAWDLVQLGAAQRALGSALEMDPDFALAAVSLSEVFMFQNQWDTARGLLQEALRHDRALTQADRYRVEALKARASADPFAERSALYQLIRLQPRCKECIYQLGESYFHTADAEKAIEQYRQVIGIDPDFGRAYNHLGYCYSWKGEHDRAIGQLRKYFDLDKSGNASDSLGDAYMMGGDYARAVEAKKQALGTDPSLYFAIRSLAYLDLFGGRYRAAATTIDKALSELAGDDQTSRFLASLAFLSYRQGKFERALEACARGLDLKKHALTESPVEELLWLQGLSELGLHRPAAARVSLGHLERALHAGAKPVTANNFKPVFKHWLHLSAACDAAAGRPESAMKALEELSANWVRLGYWGTPYDAAFFLTEIGRLARSLGRPAEAERWLRDALAYNEHFAPARLQLAGLLLEAGKKADARTELAHFLDEWKGADRDSPESISARAFERALDAR